MKKSEIPALQKVIDSLTPDRIRGYDWWLRTESDETLEYAKSVSKGLVADEYRKVHIAPDFDSFYIANSELKSGLGIYRIRPVIDLAVRDYCRTMKQL